jgi:hypothetical protein
MHALWFVSSRCSEISLSFPEQEDAEHAMMTIQVDEELQPEKIHRTLSVKGNDLVVYVEHPHLCVLIRSDLMRPCPGP